MSAIRNDNEIIVVFDDDRTVETPPLFQYDKGIIIEFRDIPDLLDVQFSNIYSNETINKTIIDGKVTIPDSLLEELSGIVAYIKYINANSEWTEKVLSIPIKQRQKPSDYITEEDEPSFRSDMQQIMEDTKQIAEDTKELVENLELTDEQIEEISSRIDLTNYVKTSTKVANRPLTKDITSAQIAQEIMNDSNAQNTVTTGVDYFLMGGKGSLQTNNKTNYVKAINEVNALAKQNKEAIENFDLSDFYNKTEIDNKFADLEYLESEDLLDRVRVYKGTSAPSEISSNYPDAKIGDIYIDTTNNTSYILVMKRGNIMTWKMIVDYIALMLHFDTKTEVDSKITQSLSSYDTSQVVDTKIATAIEEAISSIPMAEGSEF